MTTVREWFREARHAYRPATDEEGHLLLALRREDWMAAEFWALLLGSALAPADGEHRWELDGYAWVCRRCDATVPSEEIGEAEPPLRPDPECRCRACRPCEGRPPCG